MHSVGCQDPLLEHAWHCLLKSFSKRLISARGAWSAAAIAETCVSHPSSKADRVPQCLMEHLMLSSGSVPIQGQLLPQRRGFVPLLWLTLKVVPMLIWAQ